MNASPALRMIGLAAVIALAVACAFAASYRGTSSASQRSGADATGDHARAASSRMDDSGR